MPAKTVSSCTPVRVSVAGREKRVHTETVKIKKESEDAQQYGKECELINEGDLVW